MHLDGAITLHVPRSTPPANLNIRVDFQGFQLKTGFPFRPGR
jgi:hypothetical protein